MNRFFNKTLLGFSLILIFSAQFYSCGSLRTKHTDDGLFSYSYQKKGDWVSIEGYLGSEPNVVIPEYIGKRRVASIGLFYQRGIKLEGITSITLPDLTGRVKFTDSAPSNNNLRFYYLTNGCAAGTYSWKDGNYFFNGELLQKNVALIFGMNSRDHIHDIKYINGRSSESYKLVRYVGETGGETAWRLPQGSYTLQIAWKKTIGNSYFQDITTLNSVNIEAGKMYHINIRDVSDSRTRLIREHEEMVQGYTNVGGKFIISIEESKTEGWLGSSWYW